MSIVFSSSTTAWTCFCGNTHPETEDMPDRCPRCGGVWCRPLDVTRWQQMKYSIRKRFQKTRTFDSADELIAWLEDRS